MSPARHENRALVGGVAIRERYDLAEFEWSVIQPLVPNKPRGIPRADDRRVLNGIFWVLRTGAPWRNLPERSGPYTTCYNRLLHEPLPSKGPSLG
jgi:transposase